MYSGASGVLLGMFKYIKMLKYEMVKFYATKNIKNAELVKKEAQATEIELMQAIQNNMKELSKANQ
jgi:hypothetical protein